MITVRLYGGLGNQMFQYAAAYALAKRRGSALRLEMIADRPNQNAGVLASAFKLPNEIIVKQSPPLTFISRVKRRLKLRGRGVWYERHFHFHDDLDDLPPTITIDGYFQSWRYFEEFNDEIRSILSLQQPSKYFSDLRQKIAEAGTSVSLHVRRGDYLTSQAQKIHGSLSLDYYRNAIEIVSGVVRGPHAIFVFSDDVNWVAQNFDLPPGAVIVPGSSDRPWEDMLLMSECRHHILANSTFSWWGAWLATAERGKCVIAPRQWFTAETMRQKNTADLYPPGWWLI